MAYQIKYTKIDSSPALEAYIDEKLVLVLKKLGGGNIDAWQIAIEVGRDSLHHRKGEVWFAEVTGNTAFGYVRARSEASEIHEAIDLCEEELKSGLAKSKGRITTKGLHAARRAKEYIRLSRLARFFRRK
jgi:ribosomal subunit interface protein